MSTTRSTVRIKTLSISSSTRTYGCAEPVQDFFPDLQEYSFIPEEAEAVTWEEWVDYLSEMGMPIVYDKKINEIKLTDISFITTPAHLLWTHSIIRMNQEVGRGFISFIRIVMTLRKMPKLNKYDNFQIMQLATFFENTITGKSAAYSHSPFPSLINDDHMIVKLLPFEKAMQKFKYLQGLTRLSLTPYATASLKSIRNYLNSTSGYKIETSWHKVGQILSFVNSGRTTQQYIEANIDKVLKFMEDISATLHNTLVICTNIGTHEGLIKGNRYLVEETSRNRKIVTIKDLWGINVKTRHFKVIL